MSEYGLQVGTVVLGAAGPITFGPEGILFLADNSSAQVYAVDVGDAAGPAGVEPFDLADVDAKIAGLLGCGVDDVIIQDLAVHPTSHSVYLSVQRGVGADARPVLLRVDHLTGAIDEVGLDAVPFAVMTIADAPAPDDGRVDGVLWPEAGGEEIHYGDLALRILRQPIRAATITDMAYVDGSLLVAGLSNEEFSSKLRRIPFPFAAEPVDSSLEIFHVSHGKWETAAPIRTFVPYENGTSILASYTCTPVVHFALADLVPGTKVVGRTVADLGSVNRPTDMVTFTEDGQEYLLVANTSHGLLKMAIADIELQSPLTEPSTEPAGVPREVEDLQGIMKLANLNGRYVLALQKDDAGRRHLRSLKTASL